MYRNLDRRDLEGVIRIKKSNIMKTLKNFLVRTSIGTFLIGYLIAFYTEDLGKVKGLQSHLSLILRSFHHVFSLHFTLLHSPLPALYSSLSSLVLGLNIIYRSSSSLPPSHSNSFLVYLLQNLERVPNHLRSHIPTL